MATPVLTKTWQSITSFFTGVNADFGSLGHRPGGITRVRCPQTGSQPQGIKPGSRLLVFGRVCSQTPVKCCWQQPKEQLREWLHFNYFSPNAVVAQVKPPLGTGSSKQSLSFESPMWFRWETWKWFFFFFFMKCEGIFFADKIQNQFVSVCLRYPAAHRRSQAWWHLPTCHISRPWGSFQVYINPTMFYKHCWLSVVFPLLDDFMFSPPMWGLATFEAESAGSSLCAEVCGFPKKTKPAVDLQKIHDSGAISLPRWFQSLPQFGWICFQEG